MDHYIYVGMSGATETHRAQQIKMNNLANANTPGFRADFSEIVGRKLEGGGFDSRSFAILDRVSSNLQVGSIRATGLDLDVALSDGAWFAVTNTNGELRYSRRGDFTVDIDGFLRDGAGNQIMGSGGPINIPPSQKIDIGGDGTISIIPFGSNPDEKVVLDQIKTIVPKPEDIFKAADGLFALKPDSVLQDTPVMMRSGYLEESNVNPILALFDMLQLANHHELNLRMIEMAKQNDEVSSQLLRVGA